jgi:N-acetylmuramic acid 6-phosphate etherase
MVRSGKAYGNLMVDVQATNDKLKDRARRIISIATGVDYEAAGKLLKSARNDVKAAIVMQRTGLTLSKALATLRKSHDSVREAVGDDAESRLRVQLGLDKK